MRVLFLLLFFLSGAAGLSYEVAWTRSMIFVLGNTNLAVGLVLAVFLLGFFLGSLKGASWGRERSGLLKRYALVEVGIGVFGFLFPFLADIAKAVYPAVAGWAPPDLIRAAFCVLVLLIPTFLMGATFPLMNGIFITRHNRAAGGAGLIYGVQTLGAAAGALVAGFYLVRLFGLSRTSWIIASVNLLVALVAFLLSLKTEGAEARRDAEGSVSVPETAAGGKVGPGEAGGSTAIIYAALFCTGFASLALEVLWTRILVFFVDGLTYSFTAMLAVYLLALGAGSAFLAFWDRIRKPGLASGGIVLVLGGIATVACLLWIPHLYGIIQSIKGDLAAYSFENFLLSAFSGSALIIFLPSFLMGMMTPLAIGILVREKGCACREAGFAYATSCLGCCAGALVASWFIVPLIGLKTGVVMAGLLVLTAGVMIFNASRAFWALKLAMSLGPISLAFYLALQAITPQQIVVDSHVFKRSGRQDRVVLENYREGNVCTASVVCDKRNRELRLYTDGFSAASTGPEYRYMRMMAHLPVAACRSPERSLVICYGTGTTAGSLSLHPDVREMEIVEISQAVIDVAPHFRVVNHGVGLALGGVGPAGDARSGSGSGEGALSVSLHTGVDGRDFLNLCDEGFDLITLEPLMPYTPAAVHFYTAEFYELCLEKMNAGGVLCQWVPLNALPLDDLALVLGTFASSMPSSAFFNFENSVLLLGFTTEEWSLSAVRAAGVFAGDKTGRDLAAAGCVDPAALFGAFICDGGKMRTLAGGKGSMHDDRTGIEYVPIAPGAEAYRRMSLGFGFLADALESVNPHIDWEGSGEEDRESLDEAIRSYGLSMRYLLRGIQAEYGRAYQQLYPRAGLTDEDPGRLFEKAFHLNPRDRRAARKHALSLVAQAKGLLLAADFGAAREMVDRAALFAKNLFDLDVTKALLCLAGRDVSGFESALDRMAMARSYSNIELALRIHGSLLGLESGGEGVSPSVEDLERQLTEWGGVTPFEAKLLEKAVQAATESGGEGEPLDVERLVALLKAGHHGVTGNGGLAWTAARKADVDLLEDARGRLLAELTTGGGAAASAATGLAFFKDEEVLAALRDAYIGAGSVDRATILAALFRAGDRIAYIEVLRSPSSPPVLALKAAELAATAGSRDAVSPLIDLLEHRSDKVRAGALVALIEITGLRFDFDPYGEDQARTGAVARWRQWNALRKDRGKE
jgi:spermidine synthase